MAKLFITNAGKVGKIMVGGLPAIVTVAGFSPTAAIITNVGVGQGANVQIQPSLAGSLYVYAFGDSMGSIRLGGMSFIAKVCSGGGGGSQKDGIKELMEFYAANRVSRSLKHINVTIGATVFKGFLLKMQMQIQDAENRFFTWTMDIAAIPNFEGLSAGAAASQESTGESGNESDEAWERVVQLLGNSQYTVRGTSSSSQGAGTNTTFSNYSGTSLTSVRRVGS